jgi:hypothetical protein
MSREHHQGCIPSRIMSPWLSSALGKVAYARTGSPNIGDLVATVAGDCDAPIRRGGQLPGPVLFRRDRRASHRSGIVRLRRRWAQRSGMSGRIGPGGMGDTLVMASPLCRRFFPRRLRIMSDRLPNQPPEPTETSTCRGSIIKGASRVPSCLRGSAHRSIRMTRHASGWFCRLREACCGHVAEEATVGGTLRGHGQEGPRIARMIAAVGPYQRSDLPAPISVIRSQKQSGSNQALEPTETSSCRGSIMHGASRVAACLRGSVQRSAQGFIRRHSAI